MPSEAYNTEGEKVTDKGNSHSVPSHFPACMCQMCFLVIFYTETQGTGLRSYHDVQRVSGRMGIQDSEPHLKRSTSTFVGSVSQGS